MKVETNRSVTGVIYGRLMSGPIPDGAEVFGTVKRDDITTGALVRLGNGVLVEIAQGAIRNLPPTEAESSS